VRDFASRDAENAYLSAMTLKIALMAVAALVLVALSPTQTESRVQRVLRTVVSSQTPMRGIIEQICPECCRFVDESGQAITLMLREKTLIAGSVAAGDHVDVLAMIEAGETVALSIVKTR
jgi:hypothetical protein